jgi:staphylococcal nuclease domain-containing protein 1
VNGQLKLLKGLARTAALSIKTLTVGVTAGDKDLSLALLESGLGALHPAFNPDRVVGASQLTAAQDRAQRAQRGQWRGYDQEAAAAEAAAVHTKAVPGVATKVTVTHVASGGSFYLQPAEGEGAARVAWVARACADAAAGGFEGFSASVPRPRDSVLAQFSGDQQWHRGYVEAHIGPREKPDALRIYFTDFGNYEDVPLARVRSLVGGPTAAMAIAAVPPLATRASLAYLRVPDLDDRVWGEPAARTLASLTLDDGPFAARVVRSVRATGSGHPRDAAAVQHVLLGPVDTQDGAASSVNAAMLAAGMARLPARQRSERGDATLAALQRAQEAGLREHAGMFRYGDPGDSDDE